MIAEHTPIAMCLESSTVCQLRCPGCVQRLSSFEPLFGKGQLSQASLVRICERNPFLHLIEISNYGEPLLNRELPAMLDWAHDQGVLLSCFKGSNLNTVSDGLIEAMARSGLLALACAIDGVTQETYGKYRVGGHLHTVLAHIRRINEAKKKLGTELPYLIWEYVLFDHNVSEVEQARRMAAELDMHFFLMEGYLPPPGGVDRATARSLGAMMRDPEVMTGNVCGSLYAAPQINWDGKLLGCTFNFWGSLGTLEDHDWSLRALLSSGAVKRMRAILEGETPSSADDLCSRCELHRSMQKEGGWLWSKVTPKEEELVERLLAECAGLPGLDAASAGLLTRQASLLRSRQAAIRSRAWSAEEENRFIDEISRDRAAVIDAARRALSRTPRAQLQWLKWLFAVPTAQPRQESAGMASASRR